MNCPEVCSPDSKCCQFSVPSAGICEAGYSVVVGSAETAASWQGPPCWGACSQVAHSLSLSLIRSLSRCRPISSLGIGILTSAENSQLPHPHTPTEFRARPKAHMATALLFKINWGEALFPGADCVSAPSSWSAGRERGPSWGALSGPLLRQVPPRQGPGLVRPRCPRGWPQPLPKVLSHQEAPQTTSSCSPGCSSLR